MCVCVRERERVRQEFYYKDFHSKKFIMAKNLNVKHIVDKMVMGEISDTTYFDEGSNFNFKIVRPNVRLKSNISPLYQKLK